MAVKLYLGTSAGSPLPAAVANPRVRADHGGAHGVTRPTCPTVAKNGSRPFNYEWGSALAS